MQRFLKKTVVVIFLLSTRTGFASPGDSASVKVPTILHFTTPQTGITGMLNYFPLDTSLNDLQVFNPALKYFYNDLGNICSAADPQVFSLRGSLLTETGNHSLALYQWNPSRIRFYKTNKRFSNLDYHMSGGKEQQITITLAQNILPNWNAGIDFNRQGSPGFLSNGRTFATNFNFFSWYHLLNNRYHAFVTATWNSIKNEVNGGLLNDSLYLHNNFSNNDLKGLQVGLSDATQHTRNHIFSLVHFCDLVTAKDTGGISVPFIRLEHQSEYERASYAYDDNNSDTGYYEHNYFTPDIKDSLHADQWTNRLTLQTYHTFMNFKPIHLASFELTGGSQWFRYKQLYDTTLTNYFAETRLRTSGIKNLTTLDVTGRYIFSGANQNDYLFRLSFGFPLFRGAGMHIGLQDAMQSPALNFNFYQSDHFIWQNDFDKISSRQFFFGIDLDKNRLHVAGTSTIIGRYLYYDTLALPAQSHDSIRVSQLFIQKDFSFWKFRFNNRLWIQETNSDEVRIPGLTSHHTLYYEDRFFADKLSAQIGFDVHYTSSYFSNAYSPAASVFYMQNDKKTNGYALVDFFINLKIKTARIFFKIQNAGDNIIADHYLRTLNYPMPGLVFQFGVNWRFFD